MTDFAVCLDGSAPDRTWLGPRPDLTLDTLSDLGLCDAKIGRYFGVDASTVAALRHRYGATGAEGSPPMSRFNARMQFRQAL